MTYGEVEAYGGHDYKFVQQHLAVEEKVCQGVTRASMYCSMPDAGLGAFNVLLN